VPVIGMIAVAVRVVVPGHCADGAAITSQKPATARPDRSPVISGAAVAIGFEKGEVYNPRGVLTLSLRPGPGAQAEETLWHYFR
jgi:hypothetical protein